MWAVYLSEDPSSKLFRVPIEERRQNIAVAYLKDPLFDWAAIEYAIDMYPRALLSKDEVLFKIWADKLDELTKHLRSLDMVTEEAKVIKIMEKMDKIWSSYDKIKTKMIDSSNKTQLHGGASESKRESRSKR